MVQVTGSFTQRNYQYHHCDGTSTLELRKFWIVRSFYLFILGLLHISEVMVDATCKITHSVFIVFRALYSFVLRISWHLPKLVTLSLFVLFHCFVFKIYHVLCHVWRLYLVSITDVHASLSQCQKLGNVETMPECLAPCEVYVNSTLLQNVIQILHLSFFTCQIKWNQYKYIINVFISQGKSGKTHT